MAGKVRVLFILWSFSVVSANNSSKTKNNDQFDWCPLAIEIYPCSCEWAEDLGEPDLYCHDIENVEQLQKIFQTAHFPEKRFWRIRLSESNLGDLPADLFNKVEFDEVHLNDCNITSVHPEAFRASKPNMDTMELYSNLLQDDTFPWSTLGEYPSLWRVHLHHNHFTTFPNLTSESIEDINLWANPITTFSRESFQGASNLRIIEVSPNIESFPVDSFLSLTELEELHLSNNRLGNLTEGQIHLNSTKFAYLYLANNTIADIQPDAITGVTSTRLKVFLENNFLTKLKEEVFFPLMDRMLDGWGEVDLEGNPLICDCDMYWLLSNDTLLSNIRSGSCNGTDLHDVDISNWNCTNINV